MDVGWVGVGCGWASWRSGRAAVGWGRPCRMAVVGWGGKGAWPLWGLGWIGLGWVGPDCLQPHTVEKNTSTMHPEYIRVHLEYIQITSRLHPDYIIRIHPEYIQNASRIHPEYIRIYPEYVQNAS